MNRRYFIVSAILLFTIAILPVSAKADGEKNPNRTDYKGTHELEFSVGLPTIQSSMLLYDLVQGTSFFLSQWFGGYFDHESDGSSLEPVESKAFRLPIMRVEYGYNVSGWFNIGCGVYYGFNQSPLCYTETGKFAWNEKEHVTSIMLNLKFYWLNRGIVRMYSGFGAGVGMITTNMLATTKEESTEMQTMLMPSVDIRLLGLTVGRKLYGRFELGALSSGIITAGIGYRF